MPLAVNDTRVAVHPTVFANLWIYDSPAFAACNAFAEQLATRPLPILIAPRSLPALVLRLLALDMSGVSLDPQIAGQLASDVQDLFTTLQRLQRLRLYPTGALSRRAFMVATAHRIPFDDALCATLAMLHGVPLLVADAATLQGLEPVAAEYDGANDVRLQLRTLD